MDKEFIVANDISLASVIRNELKRLGVNPKYTKVTDFQKFSKEELASVQKLKLENGSFEDIAILEYCTNLRELTIKSQNSKYANTYFSTESQFNYQSKQSKIKDFSVISKLKSLQFLTIIDDPTVDNLDLTELTNLSSLELIGNHHLKEIKGLENLTQLTEMTMVNNSISSSFDIEKMISNGLLDINLDFDLYPMIIKKCPNLSDTLKRTNARCSWSENLSDIRFNSINTYHIEQMDKKVREILNQIIGPDYSSIEKISAIYAYIIQNVSYDYEALKASKDADARKEFSKHRGNSGELISTTLDRRQSSYNAILEGRSVCEGYANMMHYLLKSVGIESMTVHCSSEMDTKIVGYNSNHSVIKAILDGQTYYFDPTWDAQKNIINNFFKTKEEFSKNHILSMTEDIIDNPRVKPYTNQQLTEIFDNVLEDLRLGRNQIKNRLNSISANARKHDSSGFYEIINQQLKFLQEQYGAIAKQIEQLMKQNSESPVDNYQEQLNLLISKRDMINTEMGPIISSHDYWKQIYDEEQNRKRTVELNNNIREVEQLLDIRINPTAIYEYDNETKQSKQILKDTSALSKEQGIIIKKLDQMFYDGDLDVKSCNKMKMAVIHIYNEFIKRAPRSAKTNNQYYEHQEEYPDFTSQNNSQTSMRDGDKIENENHGMSM